ncbi:MAG: hypothetical protein J6V25_01600 [Oscillospiraceae bacterium]|nr:hypothetical protein [Oscillospiraceae bacterium]
MSAEPVAALQYNVKPVELSSGIQRTALTGGYIASLEGSWQKVTINDNGSNIQTHARVFNQTVYDCNKFTLTVNIEMKNGARCTDWNVYARTNGTFRKIDTLYLSGGTGQTSKVFSFRTPLTFDAIAIYPTANGSYSWSFGIAVSDVYTGSNTGSNSGSGSGNNGGSGNRNGYIAELDYDLEKVVIENGRNRSTVYAHVFNQTIYNCTEMTIAMDVTMNSGTNCKEWLVWGRSGNTFVKIGSINLPAGDGYTSATLYFRNSVSFNALAITPSVPGSYSYSMDFNTTDVYYNNNTSSGSGSSGSGSGSSMSGHWESVKIRDGNNTYNVSALAFNQTIYRCKSFTIDMEVAMKNGTNCKEWQLWGRSGNTFVKIAVIKLPAGDGSTSQNISFSSPVTFDALAITPKVPGSYSWSMNFSIRNVITK